MEFCRNLDIRYVGIAPPGPYYDFEKLWKEKVGRDIFVVLRKGH